MQSASQSLAKHKEESHHSKYFHICGNLPFGMSARTVATKPHSDTGRILYQSCKKDPTHSLCSSIPREDEPGYIGLAPRYAYESCGIIPLDIPHIGKKLAVKPVEDAFNDHVRECAKVQGKYIGGTCKFVESHM